MTLLLVLLLLAARAALVSSRAFDTLETETLAELAARAPRAALAPRGLVKRGGWFNYDEWKVRGVNLGGW